jgi:hypothetical protein
MWPRSTIRRDGALAADRNCGAAAAPRAAVSRAAATAVALAVVAAAAGTGTCACGGNGGRDGGGGGPDATTDGGTPCTVPTVSWSAPAVVDSSGSGYENVLRFTAAGDPWVATIRGPVGQGTCMFGGLVDTYDILFVEPDGTGGYTPTIVNTTSYVYLAGLSMEISPGGDPCMAFAGTGTGAPPTLSCGAHDLLFACRAGGAWAAPTTVIADSNTGESCGTGGQNVCNVGDVTGIWAALGFNPSGAPGIAYRDQHFGWNKCDFASADLELATAPSIAGGWSSTAMDPSEGGGEYPDLEYDLTGAPIIVHGSYGDGLELTRYAAGAWTTTLLTPDPPGERPQIEVAPDGTIWVAYFAQLGASGTLTVMRSTDDGTTWTPESVDTNGVTGQFPSLRLTADGLPAVSYYRCSDPGGSSCDTNDDALRFAYYACGDWHAAEVPGVADNMTFAGMWSSLDFDPAGNPGVAYQEQFSDPGGTIFRSVKLVRGEWQ